MNLILPLLPVAWQPYAKSILAFIGTLLTFVALVIPNVPTWVTLALSALTALGVYTQPNATLPNVVETVAPDGTRIAGPASPLLTGSVIPASDTGSITSAALTVRNATDPGSPARVAADKLLTELSI